MKAKICTTYSACIVAGSLAVELAGTVKTQIAAAANPEVRPSTPTWHQKNTKQKKRLSMQCIPASPSVGRCATGTGALAEEGASAGLARNADLAGTSGFTNVQPIGIL
jgi:hypothetical protein